MPNEVMRVLEWTTSATEAPCADAGCSARRVANVSHCAEACRSVPLCTHAVGVVRRKATWCYLKGGDARLQAMRCATREALTGILMPTVIVVRGDVHWSNGDPYDVEERSECSTWANRDLQRWQALPPAEAGSLDQAFREHCGPQSARGAPGSLKAQLRALHVGGFPQRRLGSYGNVARDSRQVRCYWELARTVSLRAPRRAKLRVCETGFNAGHAALVLLSALPPSSTYLGFDLGTSLWSHQVSRIAHVAMHVVMRVHVLFMQLI